MNKVIQGVFLMRHADPNFDIQSILALSRSVEKLQTQIVERFPHSRLRILHASDSCTKNTVVMMRIMLQKISIRVEVDARFNRKKFMISQECVAKVAAECLEKTEVCLIVSHAEDIERCCGKNLGFAEYLQLDLQRAE